MDEDEIKVQTALGTLTPKEVLKIFVKEVETNIKPVANVYDPKNHKPMVEELNRVVIEIDKLCRQLEIRYPHIECAYHFGYYMSYLIILASITCFSKGDDEHSYDKDVSDILNIDPVLVIGLSDKLDGWSDLG